jgi:hypothetical protein
MPTFDFDNTGVLAQQQNPLFGASTNSVTHEETESGQTVKFTLSVQDVSGTYRISFFPPGGGNMIASNGAFGSADVFSLTFVDTAAAGNNQLTESGAGNIVLNFDTVGTGWNAQFVGTLTTSTKAVPNNSTLTVDTGVTGAITKIVFTTSGLNKFLSLDSISGANVSCFMPGTRIATPYGPRTVESLEPGDKVLTANGDDRDVKWIGKQFIDTTRMHPAAVNPICISAGALAAGLPERDLLLSPDHAVEIDGLLINASALINGTSIYQIRGMPSEGFVYYHVEVEAHELLLAEGVAAESFLAVSGTFGFDNTNQRVDRPIVEMNLRRVTSARMLPNAIRARLAARANSVLPKVG